MKNLVIVMAGDGSLHEGYAADRDFELWVVYWGDDDAVAERYRESCDRLFRIKGQKWALVRAVGAAAREQELTPFSEYDYVFLPDDDIAFPGGAKAVSEVFERARDVKADIFQPAIANEHYSRGWEATRRIPDAVCHATSIVEIMMPGYSGEIFEHCVLSMLHVQIHVTTGWGLEVLFARSAEYMLRRPLRTFVLDDKSAIHTRPVGQGSSTYFVGADESFLNPLAAAGEIREFAHFRSVDEALRFEFPALDSILDRDRITKHMDRANGARRLLRLMRDKGPNRGIRRLILFLAMRFLREDS